MLLEIIFVLIIIYFLMNIMLKSYFKPTSINKEANKLMKQEGIAIDTSNYKAIKDDTIKEVEEINKQYEKQLEELTKITP